MRSLEWRHFVVSLAAGLAAAAIAPAQASASPRKLPGNPASYEVFGQRYNVLGSAEGYTERGVASWYGRRFHGNRTASGERFDMFALTAAHRTLPIPTDVEVTNPRNGKTIIVRVNDRGPFVGNRIIDLSYSAAHALGLVEAGTGLVEIRALRTPHVASRRYVQAVFLQVGAYSRSENAERMRVRLEAAGFEDVFLGEDSVSGRRLVRVRIGPVVDETIHDRLLARLAGIGIDDAFLSTDPAGARAARLPRRMGAP